MDLWAGGTVSDWEQDHRDAAVAAGHVTCPLCGAVDGQSCTYPLAIREEGTERFLRWELVERIPHQPRVAVATDGRIYGYTLRRLLATCRCGEDAAMAGRHTAPMCPWNLPGRQR